MARCLVEDADSFANQGPELYSHFRHQSTCPGNGLQSKSTPFWPDPLMLGRIPRAQPPFLAHGASSLFALAPNFLRHVRVGGRVKLGHTRKGEHPRAMLEAW